MSSLTASCWCCNTGFHIATAVWKEHLRYSIHTRRTNVDWGLHFFLHTIITRDSNRLVLTTRNLLAINIHDRHDAHQSRSTILESPCRFQALDSERSLTLHSLGVTRQFAYTK
jgi:hypothetical protein